MRKTPPARDLTLSQSAHPGADNTGANAATVRPTDAQRRYLERGLAEPGGKLPLFDRTGREVPHKTIQACIAHGWAEPWVVNPIKPEWLVCRLTPKGIRALNHGSGGSPRTPDADPEGR